jgi:hypothetical protein
MPGRGAARVRVDRISASRGIQPFLFEAPDQAPGPADSAPRIERIQPTVATYGAILEVQGSGFLGTTEVFFSKALSTSPTAAGFQVISDTLLKVEVPPSADGSAVPRPPIDLVHRNQKWKWPFAPLRPHFLIVVNPKGATVTVPASPSGRPLREVYDLFQYVGPGQISTRVNGIYFVDSQGLASQSAGIFFLKNGAMLATTSAAAVFMEPQAEIPSTLDNPRKCHHVESVSASPLSKMLVILTPYY